MQLDDIHRTHGQSCAIDHAANGAIEGHIVELPLGSVGLPLVFLRRIVHRLQLRLTIQRVRVDNHFGVKAMEIPLVGDHQRVHLNQRQIFIGKQFCQAHENSDELFHLNATEAKPEREVPPLKRLGTNQRINFRLEDFFGSFLGDLFNFDAALGRRHEDDTPAGAIHHGTQVQLISNIGAGFNQDAGHGLTRRIRLICHQSLAQPMRRKLSHGFGAVHELHSARLAAPARMDLRLDHPSLAANIVGRLDRRLSRVDGVASRYRQAVVSEQGFALVLMQIHNTPRGNARSTPRSTGIGQPAPRHCFISV